MNAFISFFVGNGNYKELHYWTGLIPNPSKFNLKKETKSSSDKRVRKLYSKS